MDNAAAAVLAGPRLELRQVTVRAGAVTVLDSIDLVLPLRARTLVIGPNGAGKTTLLQALMGLLPLAGGSVRGLDAQRGGAGVRFAFVFQKPVMLRRSARENVEHALALAGVSGSARRERALEALQDVALDYAADRPARRLSGGEQQRLAVARANALDPDCLLLDEPTASLDPGASAGIERYLLRLSERGRGFVMTSHDLRQARRLAQYVVFMHRGRVVESGEAAAFFARPRTETAQRFLDGDWLE